MEDNNSFLEPEIESSLSEEVDKPAEELVTAAEPRKPHNLLNQFM